jgi:hypothetical protein
VGLINKIIIEGTAYLGVALPYKKPTAADRAGGKKDAIGHLLKEGVLSPWEIIGYREEGGQLYLYGPLHEGRTFKEMRDQRLGHQALLLLSDLLHHLRKQSLLPEQIHLETLLFPDDGGILILPPSVARSIIAYQPEEERLSSFNSYNHPDLRGISNGSFLLGVLAYEIYSGEHPYPGESINLVHQKMRELPPIPLNLVKPGLKEEISLFIESSLSGPDRPAPGEWNRKLQGWSKEGFFREVPEEEKKQRSRALLNFSLIREKRFKRRDFFRRRKLPIILGAVGFVLALSILFSIIQSALIPPITVGLHPEEIISLYYSSLNTLDHQTMEACVTGGAGKEDIRMVMHLFVIDRVQTGYEGRGSALSAEQWIDSGKEAVTEGKILFGAGNLEIIHERGGAFEAQKGDKAVYQARYEWWETQTPEIGEESGRQYLGYQKTVRISLERLKNRWVIAGFEEIESHLIKEHLQ